MHVTLIIINHNFHYLRYHSRYLMITVATGGSKLYKVLCHSNLWFYDSVHSMSQQ